MRVKRPGVRVRARRGYLAATVADATAAARTGRGAAKPSPPPSADETQAAALSSAVAAAIGPLANYAREVAMRLQIAAGWKASNGESAGLWVVGEIGGVTIVGDQWAEGFDAKSDEDSEVEAHGFDGPRGFDGAEGYEAAKDDEPDVEAHAFEGPRGFEGYEGYEKPADK